MTLHLAKSRLLPAASSQPARNEEIQVALEEPPTNTTEVKGTPAPAKRNQPRMQQQERLSEQLKRQRRAQLAAQGLLEPGALAPDTTPDVERPSRQRFQTRDGREPVRKKRVDLYVNESGYPQQRQGEAAETGEQRGKHQNHRNRQMRRDHLAPAQHEDALSALTMERPSSSAFSSRRPLQEGQFDRSRNRPVRYSSPRQDFAMRGPNQANRGQQGNFERPGLSASGGNFSGARPGGGGERRGPPQRRPVRNTRPPRRRSQAGSITAPAKQLGAAPATVHAGGKYSLSTPIKGLSRSTPFTSFRELLDAAQWKKVRSQVQSSHLQDPKAVASIQKGDWEKYVAPLQTAERKHTASEKVGGRGIPKEERETVLERARMAMINNGSIGLKGKLELTKKLETAV